MSRTFIDPSDAVDSTHRKFSPCAMTLAWAMLLVALGMAGPAFAANDEDRPPTLSLKCHYAEDARSETESVKITDAPRGESVQPASVMQFRKGVKSQDIEFAIAPGEAAECVFPSGNRVRAKVGVGEGSAYGQCGGDPQVFASVWVNERKVASRNWFAGNCIVEDRYPESSFEFEGSPKPLMRKCNSVRQAHVHDPLSDSPALSSESEPLTVCVDFPDVSRYPRDEREYPPPGVHVPVNGTIERLKGTDDVCDAAQQELEADFYTFGRYFNPLTTKLARLDWGKPSPALPEHVNEENESIFDFDNDGRLDRVSSVSSETHYMDAIELKIEFGRSRSALNLPDCVTDLDAMIIPCQMDFRRPTMADCPPGSQVADEAGLLVKGRSSTESVFFRTRYSMVAPFTYRGSSLIGVSSNSGDTREFVAVLRPLPERKFQPMCLFRRVTENF